MSTQTPDETATAESVSATELSAFDDADEATDDAVSYRTGGSVSGAFRAKQRIYEATRTDE